MEKFFFQCHNELYNTAAKQNSQLGCTLHKSSAGDEWNSVAAATASNLMLFTP